MIEIREASPDSPEARWCIQQYFQELSSRFDTGFEPSQSNPANDADLTRPAGFLLVAWLDGKAVGCGALKRKTATVAEVKRMWTDPSSRQRGVGRRVLRELEALARQSGFQVLQLETNRTLVEAQTLYRAEGFLEVERFNDEQYAHHWFEKAISQQTMAELTTDRRT